MALAGIVATGACGSGEGRFTGTWELASSDGRAVPVALGYRTTTETCVNNLLSSVLEIRDGGSWRETLTNDRGCAPPDSALDTSRQTVAEEGSWRLAGDTLVLTSPQGVSQRATLDDDSLRLELPGAGTVVRFVYTRKPATGER